MDVASLLRVLAALMVPGIPWGLWAMRRTGRILHGAALAPLSTLAFVPLVAFVLSLVLPGGLLGPVLVAIVIHMAAGGWMLLRDLRGDPPPQVRADQSKR
jgi:hypothetical protein